MRQSELGEYQSSGIACPKGCGRYQNIGTHWACSHDGSLPDTIGKERCPKGCGRYENVRTHWGMVHEGAFPDGKERIPCPKGCGEFLHLAVHWSKTHNEPFPEDTRRMTAGARGRLAETSTGRRHTKETKRKIGKAHAGKTMSEEARRKISESNSGENNPLYGLERSEKTKGKIAEEHRGKRIPEETRQKISESVSEVVQGEDNPFYGKSHTEETRQRFSETRTGRRLPESHRENISAALTGVKKSREHRQAISVAASNRSEEHIRKFLNSRTYDRIGVVPTKHVVRSGWECKIDLLLHDAGIAFEYEPELYQMDGAQYLPDFRVGQDIIEVKGYDWGGRGAKKAQQFMDEHPDHRYIVIGNDALPCDVHFSWDSREGVLDVL